MLPHHMPLLYILPSQPFLADASQPPQTHVILIFFQAITSSTASLSFFFNSYIIVISNQNSSDVNMQKRKDQSTKIPQS